MGKQNSHFAMKTGFAAEGVSLTPTAEELARLKEVLLEMLRDFAAAADGQGLTWTLSGGSVLGAVRHGGIIPWDDDIDVNMPREDFDRFAAAFDSALGEKYILCTPERTPGHGILCVQIKKKGTVYRSYNELSKPEEDCGICLDIFVIENTYDNALARRLHGLACLAAGYLVTCRKTFNDMPYLARYLTPGSEGERLFRKKARIGGLFRWLPLDAAVRLGVRWYSRCRNHRSVWATIPSGRNHFFAEMHRREVLCDTVEAPFEDMTVKLPAGYDAYLRALYGDNYMELPPEEKRESHPFMELRF